MNKWEFSALPQGDELRKDGRLVVSYREAEAILNSHDQLVRLVTDVQEEKTEFNTDWDQEARKLLAALEQEQAK